MNTVGRRTESVQEGSVAVDGAFLPGSWTRRVCVEVPEFAPHARFGASHAKICTANLCEGRASAISAHGRCLRRRTTFDAKVGELAAVWAPARKRRRAIGGWSAEGLRVAKSKVQAILVSGFCLLFSCSCAHAMVLRVCLFFVPSERVRKIGFLYSCGPFLLHVLSLRIESSPHICPHKPPVVCACLCSAPSA